MVKNSPGPDLETKGAQDTIIVQAGSTDSSGQNLSNGKLAISAIPTEMLPVKNAIGRLRQGIEERFASPDYVTLAMHVNVNTAKAELIPIPELGNMKKVKENFGILPQKVQDVISKSIPEDQMKAAQEIYDFLETVDMKQEFSSPKSAKELTIDEKEER